MAAQRKYWHEVSEREYKKLVAKGYSFKMVREEYLQPDWCEYPEAITPVTGCMSLIYVRDNISREYCSDCPFCKEEPQVL